MRRSIIRIDEGRCTGCGECIPSCPEGAIQVIDGKARLVSDRFCDGLGACLGDCPEGAISLVEREAEPYDECKVMDRIVAAGENTIKAHLDHLHRHRERELLRQALEYLKENDVVVDWEMPPGIDNIIDPSRHAVVDGSRAQGASTLEQWPVQLSLLASNAPFLRDADLLLVGDCVAYALGDFHERWLKGRRLAIACPKLDTGKDEQVIKLRDIIDSGCINTITVMVMEVPCCSGLMGMVEAAMAKASRKVPLRRVVVSSKGSILIDEWMNIS